MRESCNLFCICFGRFVPTKRNITSWKLDKEIKKSLMKLIDRRRESSGDRREGRCPKDLLGLMIQASDSSPAAAAAANGNSDVTVHDIMEECKSFFFAGKQTTSNLLTWTTVLLAMHPQWQVQAREEVHRVCGSRDIPNRDDVVKLKTVKSFYIPIPSPNLPVLGQILCFLSPSPCLFPQPPKKKYKYK